MAGGAAGFAVLQYRGFRCYPDYAHTLSATARRWLGIYPARPRRLASTVGLAGLFGVLVAHLIVDPAPHHAYADPDPRYVGYESLSFRLLPVDTPVVSALAPPPAATT